MHLDTAGLRQETSHYDSIIMAPTFEALESKNGTCHVGHIPDSSVSTSEDDTIRHTYGQGDALCVFIDPVSGVHTIFGALGCTLACQ